MDIDISSLSVGSNFVPAAAVTAAPGSQEQTSPEAGERNPRERAAKASGEEVASEEEITAEEDARTDARTIDQPHHRIDSLA